MFIRNSCHGAAVAMLLALAGGCKKSDGPVSAADAGQHPPTGSNQVSSGTDSNVIARLHWVGKKRLAVDPKAAHLMSIWSLPESERLENQTLDKLSLGLFRFPNGTDPAPGKTNPISLSAEITTNQLPSKLRPLLNDLLQEESYLEVRSADSGARNGEIVFAIHLNGDRAGLWQANLSALQQQGSWVKQLAVGRAKDWILLSYPHAGGTNGLLAEFSTRIEHAGNPFGPDAASSWVDAKVDLCRVAAALSLKRKLPEMTPVVNLTVSGDGSNVVTHGQFSFPKALPVELEPWNIPTNLIHGPLYSFTAVRGMRSFVTKLFNTLQISPAPNQMVFWAQAPYPFGTFAAAPVPNAKQLIRPTGNQIIIKASPWITGHRIGKAEWLPNSDELIWKGPPMMIPFLKAVHDKGGEFLLSGLAESNATNVPPPARVFSEAITNSNDVIFDEELTGPEIERWLYIGQTIRFVTYAAQLPANSLSSAWLKAASLKVGKCRTIVTKTAADQLEFTRASSLGLSSVELHLLADWLESPRFPCSLHSLAAPGPKLVKSRSEEGH